MSAFSEFLATTKRQFLDDLQSKSGDKWTVVMGNEAGDLDSIASSIAYSYLATQLKSQPTVALVQTPRGDLGLRPENLYAFQLAGLDPKQDDLFCIDDLPQDPAFHKFVLVDHNSLLPAFQGKGKVVGIIDHHVDEQKHQDAEFREIVNPVGSCSSLVALHFKPLWKDDVPPEVATILLSALYIDTGGLKANDKAQTIDYEAASFLTPVSTFGKSSLVGTPSHPDLSSLAEELHERKRDVGHLSTRDLLRRDYKEFKFGDYQVGLATVVVGLKAWTEKDPNFWENSEAYLKERNLDILGMLNTFSSEKKGKHKREIVLLFKDTVPGEVETKLVEGLESNKDLQLETKDSVEVQGNRRARVWNQGNTKATRKLVAPLLRNIIEGNAEGSNIPHSESNI